MKNLIRKILEKLFRKEILEILLTSSKAKLEYSIERLIPKDDNWHGVTVTFWIKDEKINDTKIYVDGEFKV
jgi:hypothetical protein